MGKHLACFKAYDVRGIVPDELNPSIAQAVGIAFAEKTGAKRVCIGYDIRLSGSSLCNALTEGLASQGVEVTHLGLVGTEMVYFATAHYGFDGGIMITASHNPPQYNGMKMVRAESRPISGDTGLLEIEARAAELVGAPCLPGPLATQMDSKKLYEDFIAHLLNIVKPSEIGPIRVLADPGNGAAGPAMDLLCEQLSIHLDRLRWEPDGTFPNGVPNPILEESRAMTEAKMRGTAYDFGVAWDGDYDRCFFFDEHGNFIEGYYIVGLLTQAILARDPNHTIIYDPRLTWNTLGIIAHYGGRGVVCKSGHAFIKEKMRAEDATYGGEMSAHHYFRDHWYCDSGMIPFLLIARLVTQSGKSLGSLVGEMIANYPCSGEVNSTVADVPTTLARVEAAFGGGEIDRLDGLSVEFADWRFNLRGSNTEPVIRLNVETRGDAEMMKRRTEELLAVIRA